MLFELDPQRFLMVPGVFAKNLLYSAAKLQRDVPEFRPSVSLHDGLADAFEHLEAEGLVEDVPVGDWEDRHHRDPARCAFPHSERLRP